MTTPILRPSLPCPFCGAAGGQCHADEVDAERWTVICELCGANGPINRVSNTPGKALLFWEARATPPEPPFNVKLSQALNEGDGTYRP